MVKDQIQYHNNRSEFWKVVSGPVKVQIGDSRERLQTVVLNTGESITIPKMTLHRLIGAGTDGVVLEISTGNFDVNDIVRLDDDYYR